MVLSSVYFAHCTSTTVSHVEVNDPCLENIFILSLKEYTPAVTNEQPQ